MRRLSGVAAARVRALGLEETSPGILGYAADYAPPRLALEKLIMVPHGRTPSNERMLFQSHAEGPNATLLPSSLDEAARGAEAFLAEHGARYAASPAEFRFSRSPLRRCVETRAGKGCEIPNFKGSYLGRFPLVLADFWTSDHLSERSRP